jgi:hypothetical protein
MAPPTEPRVVEVRRGRYVRVGHSASGRPYYCWTGTTEQPDPAPAILRNVRVQFGQDGLQLLLELSEGLGLANAESAVRRLLGR